MHVGKLCGVRFAWGLRRPRSVDVGVSVQRVSEMVLWVPGGGGGTTSAWLSISAFYTMFPKSPGEGIGMHRHATGTDAHKVIGTLIHAPTNEPTFHPIELPTHASHITNQT